MSTTVQHDGFGDLRKQAEEPKPESWKPEKAGDEIAGIVAKLDSGWDREGNEHGIVVIDAAYSVQNGVRADKGIRSVWLLGEALRNQVMKASLQPGDRLLIQFLGKIQSKQSGRMYNDFKVTTDRKVSTWWDRQKSARPAPGNGDSEFVMLDDGRTLAPPPDDFGDEPAPF